jgi:hypothetical protein
VGAGSRIQPVGAAGALPMSSLGRFGTNSRSPLPVRTAGAEGRIY